MTLPDLSQQHPEDDPARKKQDLKLAIITGSIIIVTIASVIALWVFFT